jgi:putative PEP-CTERM system TPR-repeat lipoprotein
MQDKTKSKKWRWVGVGGVVLLFAIVAGGIYAATSGRGTGNYYEDAQRFIDKGDYKAAIIQLRNAIRTDPDNSQARLALASAYLRTGDAVSAEKEFKAARERGVEDDKIAGPLARAYLLQGKNEQLLKEFPRGTRGDAVEGELAVWRGYAFNSLRRSAEAEAAFKEALALKADDGRAYLGLARLYIERGQMQDAEGEVDRALSLTPDLAEGLAIKGELRRFAKDFDAARKLFTQAIDLDPTSIVARVGRAVMTVDGGEPDKAEPDVKAILAVAPAHPMANYLQALILTRRNDSRGAIDVLQKLSGALAAYPPSLYLLGTLYYSQNQFEQAESNLARYVQILPGDVRARRLLSALFMRRGAPDKAIEVLLPAVRAAPEDPQLIALLANAYNRNRQFGEAAQLLDHASSAAQQDPAFLTRAGIERLRMGQSDAGIKDLEAAIDLDPGQVQARMMLAMMQLRNRNYPQAMQAASSLRQQLPDSPVPLNLMGAIQAAQGDVAAARATLEEALKLKPDFLPAVTNLVRLDLREGNVAKATGRYEALLKSDANNLGAMMALADLAFGQEKVQDGVIWLERARKANPQAVQPLMRLIEVHIARRDGQKALVVARELQAVNPNQPETVDALARSQLAAGETASAISTFRQLTNLAPQSPAAHQRLARALIVSGDDTQAAASLRQALRLDDGFLPALSDLIDLELRSGRAQSAVKIAEDWRAKRPERADADVLVGDVLTRAGQQAQAVEAYAAALRKQVNAPNVLRLAQAQMRAGKSQEAVDGLKQWLQTAPNDQSIRVALAVAYLEMKRYDDAIQAHEELLKNEPSNTMLLNNLAWLYGEKGDPRAADLAENAFKLAPNSAIIADTLGYILVRRGDTERGVKLLEQARTQLPNNAEIGYHLAAGLKVAGRRDEARKLLEGVLGAGAKFDSAPAAQALLQELSGQ